MTFSVAAADLPRRLGDYEVLREVGRGGMGVVYEAEQVSLRRRVALKVLPFAAAMDPTRLARFRAEAQAAARLHHTNIVPVFAVGDEEGVHYTAMQFVDGRSLSAVVTELRRAPSGRRGADSRDSSSGRREGSSSGALDAGTSTRSRAFFRAVAEVGRQAAEALDHAHEMGVLHRDVKPANLLLDADGKVWVSDFGLAHLEDGDADITGDGVVGTLGYMSPEQSRAVRAPVDHRTDVYSLGATLFELVALRPAHSARSREDLYRRIMLEDPPRLRRLNSATPPELETIILKAMARSPSERYPTAQALADDLRNFLEHRPIQARRPSTYQRGLNWTRRHPAVATTAGILLVLLVATLAVSAALLWRERGKKQTALYASQASREQAETNHARTLEAVDRMLALVGEAPLDPSPHLDRVKARVLADALEFYEGALAERPGDPELRRKVGRILRYRGTCLKRLRRPDEAEKVLRRAHEISDKLWRESPEARPVREEHASTLLALGNLLASQRKSRDEGGDLLKTMVQLQEQWYSEVPEDEDFAFALAGGLQALGQARRRAGRPDAMEKCLARAIDLVESALKRSSSVKGRRRLAMLCNALGSARLHAGRNTDAEAPLARGLEIDRALLADDPDNAGLESEVGALQSNLAVVCIQTRRFDEAAERLNAAARHQRAALLTNPHRREYRDFLWNHLWNLADLELRRGRPEDAAEAARELPEIQPLALESYIDCARFLLRCGLAARGDSKTRNAYLNEARAVANEGLEGIGDQVGSLHRMARFLVTAPDPAFRQPARAVKLARRGVELKSDGPVMRTTLALALYRDGQLAEAFAAVKKAIALWGRPPEALPGFLLAAIQARRGEVEEARRVFNETAKWMEANHPRCRECRRMRREAAQVLKQEIRRARK